jgi:choline kinase
MKAVIVAAGRGSRLKNEKPKTLMPYSGKTILAHIIDHIAAGGINEFVIVVGYQGHHIKDYLKSQNYFGRHIVFVDNPEWQRGNGISVLVAGQETGAENFLLSMSDHIVSPAAIRRVIEYQSDSNLLLVDPRIKDIFDIDDATKVETNGSRIVKIGKELSSYNGIDCGIFRLTPRFYESMRVQLQQEKESISAAVTGLIGNADMHAVFMQDKEYWTDIDTPEAYQHALQSSARLK